MGFWSLFLPSPSVEKLEWFLSEWISLQLSHMHSFAWTLSVASISLRMGIKILARCSVSSWPAASSHVTSCILPLSCPPKGLFCPRPHCCHGECKSHIFIGASSDFEVWDGSPLRWHISCSFASKHSTKLRYNLNSCIVLHNSYTHTLPNCTLNLVRIRLPVFTHHCLPSTGQDVAQNKNAIS